MEKMRKIHKNPQRAQSLSWLRFEPVTIRIKAKCYGACADLLCTFQFLLFVPLLLWLTWGSLKVS